MFGLRLVFTAALTKPILGATVIKTGVQVGSLPAAPRSDSTPHALLCKYCTLFFSLNKQSLFEGIGLDVGYSAAQHCILHLLQARFACFALPADCGRGRHRWLCDGICWLAVVAGPQGQQGRLPKARAVGSRALCSVAHQLCLLFSLKNRVPSIK
jgi:hypothetical protein